MAVGPLVTVGLASTLPMLAGTLLGSLPSFEVPPQSCGLLQSPPLSSLVSSPLGGARVAGTVRRCRGGRIGPEIGRGCGGLLPRSYPGERNQTPYAGRGMVEDESEGVLWYSCLSEELLFGGKGPHRMGFLRRCHTRYGIRSQGLLFILCFCQVFLHLTLHLVQCFFIPAELSQVTTPLLLFFQRNLLAPGGSGLQVQRHRVVV